MSAMAGLKSLSTLMVFLVLVAEVTARRVSRRKATSSHADGNATDTASTLETDASVEHVEKQKGSGSKGGFQFFFNESLGHGNNLGRLVVQADQSAKMTNEGFFGMWVPPPPAPPTQFQLTQPPPFWQPGSILGKSDDFVWGLGQDRDSAPGRMIFTFDHGVSDFVLGNLRTGQGEFTPEFEEIIFGKTGAPPCEEQLQQQQPPGPGPMGHQQYGAYGGQYGAPHQQYGGPHGGFGQPTHPVMNTPDQLLQKTLREESKESTCKFGPWNSVDGFMPPLAPTAPKAPYQPKLRLKPGDAKNPAPGGQKDVPQIKKGCKSSYWTASMERPYILDIDNLFLDKTYCPHTIAFKG